MNNLITNLVAFAQEAAADAPAAAGAPANRPSPFSGLWIFIHIFGLMYFMMIRPQQKKQKQIQEMLRQLKAGDKVMLNSGALGTVDSVTEKTVRVAFSDGHKIDFVRAAVAEILPAFPGEEGKEEKK